MPTPRMILPYDNRLSLEAIGMLGTMINNPEDDYCTDEELYLSHNVNSLSTIRSALKELIAKEYVIQLDGCVYAVNKLKIPEMKVV